MDKDYKSILEKYGFKDPHGHSLEKCRDYLDLLEELAQLRRKVSEGRGSDQLNGRV